MCVCLGQGKEAGEGEGEKGKKGLMLDAQRLKRKNLFSFLSLGFLLYCLKDQKNLTHCELLITSALFLPISLHKGSDV